MCDGLEPRKCAHQKNRLNVQVCSVGQIKNSQKLEQRKTCDTLLYMPIRRKNLRAALKLPLSLGRRLPALTADVSRGGFSAELPQVFMPGSKVTGYFLAGDSEIAFAGTVAWAEAGNPQMSLYSRIGVEFDSMPEGLRPLFNKNDARKKKIKSKA
jgi:hypothetical protein